MIIGLDEYGKSSIITALIIGFGGSLKDAYGREDVITIILSMKQKIKLLNYVYTLFCNCV